MIINSKKVLFYSIHENLDSKKKNWKNSIVTCFDLISSIYLSVKTASTQKNVEKYHQSIQDSPFGHKINKDHLYLAEKSYTGHINIQWVCD